MNEQKHPQESKDRSILEQISQQGRTDYNLAELARLRIRYDNFPGAREIQKELDRILQTWNLTETELFTLTREIHHQGRIYRRLQDNEEDWS